MKKLSIKLATLLLISIALAGFSQNVGVGINPDGAEAHPSAILDVSSSQHGMLIPRMTASQKSAIPEPAEGLMIYQTDGSKGYYYFTGTIWERIIDESSQSIPVQGQAGETLRHDGTDWIAAGNLYNNGGNIGIGTSNPSSILHISNPEAANNTLLTLSSNDPNNIVIRFTDEGHVPAKWDIFRDNADGQKLKFLYTSALTIDYHPVLTLVPDATTGRIGIGTSMPDISALLDISAEETKKGFLLPRMTLDERNNINQPSTSLLIFQTDQTPGFYYNAGTPAIPNWLPLSSNNGLAAGSQAGEMLYWDGSDWLPVVPGDEGQVLAFIGGIPTWACLTVPVTPAEAQHITQHNDIKWVWNPVACATGYAWSTTNNYGTATDIGSVPFYEESGLSAITNYTRYVWAYNDYGVSQPLEMNSGTFSDVDIKAVSGGDCNCTLGSTHLFSVKGFVSSGTNYEWRACANSICSNWEEGTGTNGANYPGCECCNGTNIIIEVRGTRDYNGVTITSSVLDTHSCAAGLD